MLIATENETERAEHPVDVVEQLAATNDWSFDRFDEALIEDGDEVTVAPHMRDRIAEIRESTA